MTTSIRAGTSTPRVQLSPRPGAGPLDGAWWPRSRDLDAELADLVDHVPTEMGRVSRALFSRPDWLTHPRRITVARGFLKTGSFPSDDTHLMLLKLSTGVQLRLLVIPPDTPLDRAHELLAQAASPSNRRSGRELLARAWETSTAAGAGRGSGDGGRKPAIPEKAPASRRQLPLWAWQAARAELHEAPEDADLVRARAWQLVNEQATLDRERHDQFDDPDTGGEG